MKHFATGTRRGNMTVFKEKTIKENTDIFTEVLHLSFNALVNEGTCPSVFKLADVTLIFKKVSKNSEDSYRPISILKICKKYLETLCINRWLPSWINTFPNLNVA